MEILSFYMQLDHEIGSDMAKIQLTYYISLKGAVYCSPDIFISKGLRN
jgi:hypothetical protein